MVIFYRILDLCGVNAYVLYNQHQTTAIERGDFLKRIARDLVIPHMQRRVMTSNLTKDLKLTLQRVLGADMPPEVPLTQKISSSNRQCRHVFHMSTLSFTAKEKDSIHLCKL